MPDPENVLAALMTQMAALTTSMQDNRVMGAAMNGKLDTMIARMDGQDRDREDHESRIRDLERQRAPEDLEDRVRALEVKPAPGQDHEDRIRKLERTVWLASGVALAGGGALGTLAGKLLGG